MMQCNIPLEKTGTNVAHTIGQWSVDKWLSETLAQQMIRYLRRPTNSYCKWHNLPLTSCQRIWCDDFKINWRIGRIMQKRSIDMMVFQSVKNLLTNKHSPYYMIRWKTLHTSHTYIVQHLLFILFQSSIVTSHILSFSLDKYDWLFALLFH